MNAQLLDELTQASTYRELQKALKAAKHAGFEIGCKLNANTATLSVARNTLVAEISQDIDGAEVASFMESTEIKKPLTDSEEESFIASVQDFNIHCSAYESAKAILIAASVPIAIAEKAARVLAKDEAKAPNLGRSESDQEAIKAAWQYLVGIAAA